MKRRLLTTLMFVVALGPLGAASAEERASLDSLRLGARYLHWTPADNAPATAAATAEPAAPPPLPPGMTLAEFEALAERCNPTLAQAAARVEAARGHWVQAGLYPNPRTGYKATEIGDEGQAGQQGAFVAQEIVTAQKLQRSRDTAAAAVQQAEHAWAAQRIRVLADVRRAFGDVLVAQRSIELTDQLLRIGHEGVRAADAMFQAREVSRVDVLQARIEADSAGILAQRARHRHLAAWRNLATVAGAPDMPPALLAGDVQSGLARLTWDEAAARVLGESPQLAEARVAVARAQAALARECAERTPNLDLEAGVLYDNATRDTIAEVQAGVALPIFNRNEGNIRRARAELIAARADLGRASLELRQRLAAVFEQYENARCQVETYARDILPNAQTSLELVTSGYRQGEFKYVDLLTSQRTFFQTNLAYLDAIRELRAAAVAIDANLLGDSLQSR